MEYDFKALSDYDFELLVCDLLSARQGRRVESFRQGRDQGIDLRYTAVGGGKAVVQCKHYAKTSFSGLCSAMRRELEKIRRLSPERYLLVTSQFLTPLEKDKLLDLLTPFCKSQEDILGGSELNALLRQYPEVERTHYKLWLTSSAVLEKILHSEIYQQSMMLQEEIQNKLRLYVQSKTAYDKAHEMLKNFNCCIISGIPGIGKTTLAEILSIYYLDQGYQIIKVRSDIQEALRSYDPEQKQAFIYDDFLGSTGLDIKENKNEGKELLTFLDFISRQKGKKFILTTREYILNQARQDSEDFARADFDYKKCIISLEDYTRSDRARILYNHLFFYEVPKESIQDLLTDDRELEIIDHPNYSPRLIETVIKLWSSSGGGEDGGFYRFFSDTLDHPSQLWEHAFCRKISPAARDLLLLLCPAKHLATLSGLRQRYEEYHRYKSRMQNQPMRMTDFNDALKETERTFIHINGSYISYHNPSVRDFIHGYIKENDAEFKILCETADSFDFCIQLAYLDQDLCRSYSEEFTAALRRTADDGSSIMLTEHIIALERANHHLRMEELRRLIQQMLEALFDRLEEKREELSEETWNYGDSPCDLKRILDELCLSDYDPGLADRLFSVFFQYALAWFDWAFNYRLEDFLVFPALHSVRPFPVDADKFRKVYDALEDFSDEIAPQDIAEMDYEIQCEEYRDDIKRLAAFFHMDLSEIISEIRHRIFELEESEEDDAGDDLTEEAPSGGKLTDQEILDMFQSLLDR